MDDKKLLQQTCWFASAIVLSTQLMVTVRSHVPSDLQSLLAFP